MRLHSKVIVLSLIRNYITVSSFLFNVRAAGELGDIFILFIKRPTILTVDDHNLAFTFLSPAGEPEQLFFVE